ncbi:MAG: hypothetical protein U0670_00475 [Anaerolineae bacterium]
MKYQFVSPTGATLAGKLARSRNDLRGKLLPEPGNSVKVLYVDDQTYLLL